MEWPYRRFIKFFEAFQRRTIIDEWKQRKVMHISALYGNGYIKDLQEAVQKIENSYDEIIHQLSLGGASEIQKKTDEAMSDPFMRAGRRAKQGVKPIVMPGEDAIASLPR